MSSFNLKNDSYSNEPRDSETSSFGRSVTSVAETSAGLVASSVDIAANNLALLIKVSKKLIKINANVKILKQDITFSELVKSSLNLKYLGN